MGTMFRRWTRRLLLPLAVHLFGGVAAAQTSLRGMLDAPLLFVKQHAYMAAHIYDDYYTWRPGGGIYVCENPWDTPDKHRIRAVIDPTTPETLGDGVYRDPELWWDGTRIVFAFKGEQQGGTSIYEIGIDGKGLRRLTKPEDACPLTQCRFVRNFPGHHDITPCYLPDGRVVFTSTRARARVPCFNSGVDVLHVMDADGGNIRCLSVNNVNEFDPSVLPDGRILFGRWEYVDKTALYMQSLWTVFPDGTNETALFANNLAKPTALLDARPVPGTNLVVAALTPHNGQAVGAIAMIDTRLGKNNLAAITNFTPEFRTEMDQGLKRGCSDPWPLSADAVLMANNTKEPGVIQIVTRDGRRETVLSDPGISCYSPMLVKSRARPPVVADPATVESGRFFVQDVYRGLPGVARGEVKRLRVIEETARVSELPPGGRWWNQAFLVSWQGAYTVKNILGTVPVREDGSAFFEAPQGKALYFQALDASGRSVQSMRTFIQARPGVTRSCIGCHEPRDTAPAHTGIAVSARGEPDVPETESWGSGYLDYASTVQPVLDRRCVSCHGGEKGIAAGIDLSGGWTWAFNISYETLIKNTLTGFLNCNNGSVHTAEILPPRAHGSGAAPLGNLLVEGHKNRLAEMTQAERDLLMAWMDTNCNYYGTWDWTPTPTCKAVIEAGAELAGLMQGANCTKCHVPQVGNDWINLRDPRMSRILRAPLAKTADGLGLAWCRDRKARAPYPLVTQRQQPPDVRRPARTPPPDLSGDPVVSFASSGDASYEAMLRAIRKARTVALATPRVDMPGAVKEPGQCRQLVTVPLPSCMPSVQAEIEPDGAVRLRWQGMSELIGLEFSVYRLTGADDRPGEENRVATTTLCEAVDGAPPPGRARYLVIPSNGEETGAPAEVAVEVPLSPPVPAPAGLHAVGVQDAVELVWEPVPWRGVRYHVERVEGGKSRRLTEGPIAGIAYVDVDVEPGKAVSYIVRAVSRQGRVGEPSTTASAAALPVPVDPVLQFPVEGKLQARLLDGSVLAAKAQGKARVEASILDLGAGGNVVLPYHDHMSVKRRFTVEVGVHIEELAKMPVILACGNYGSNGWFLQAFGGRWRWHLAGTSCDGGKVEVGKWTHIVATYDKERARLYQDGKLVADVPCPARLAEYRGPLIIGQYTRQESSYQVLGKIRDLRVYHRVLDAEDVAGGR